MKFFFLRTRMQRFNAFVIMCFLCSQLTSCKHLQSILSAAFQRPQMLFKTMHLKDVNFKGIDLDFEFECKNPNAIGLTLNQFSYDLAVEGSSLFKGVNSKQMTFKANSSSPIHVPFGLEFEKFAQSLMSFFQKRDSVPYNLALNFGLQTPIGVISIPVKQAGNIPVPKIPEVSLQNVDVKLLTTKQNFFGRQVSVPTGAQLNFNMLLKQLGKFPVKLQGLNYDISMGGQSIMKSATQMKPLQIGQQQSVNIPIKIGKTQAIQMIRAIVQKKFDFKFNGDVDLGAFKLPLNFGPNDTKLQLPDVGGLAAILKILG